VEKQKVKITFVVAYALCESAAEPLHFCISRFLYSSFINDV
jgi:hypothetical protein